MSTFLIRKYIVFSLLFVTPAGFLFKLYSGPAQWWFNNYGAGLLYEVFWILVISFFLPSKKWVNKIPVWVFLITCALEIIQLWDPWLLQKVRAHFWGRTLIGTSFAWWDFPHYAIGTIIGWVWIKAIIGHSSMTFLH